jgi:hypothetical protein
MPISQRGIIIAQNAEAQFCNPNLRRDKILRTVFTRPIIKTIASVDE